MNSKEKCIKSALIKTTNSIRKKFKQLHETQLVNQEHLKELYKPITTSIDKINLSNKNDVESNKKKVKFNFSTPKTTPSRRRLFNETTDLFSDYDTANSSGDDEDNNNNSNENQNVNDNSNLDDSNAQLKVRAYLLTSPAFKSPSYDNLYGVRKDGNKFKIGNADVNFDNGDVIISGEKYKYSRGLYNLLFRVKPDVKYQTDDDLKIYKNILQKTNAHRVNYDSNSKLRHSNTYKYLSIIRPMFIKGGSGLSDYMKVNNNKIDYKYWDDPDELVNRLRLLVSSKTAGHTGHDNEILAIIEELKEANLII